MRGPRAAKNREAELLKRVNELEHETAKLWTENSALLHLTHRIGHDFNNVLQAIIGDTERVAEDRFDRAQDSLEAILVSASKGVDLVRELLAIGHEGERLEPSAAKTPAPSQGPNARSSRGTAVSARILVVDDLQSIREFTRAVLAKAGYEVAVAANGAEALAAVRDADFALVLMDIHMPIMNGLTATRKIRELIGPRSDVAIVAISGNVPLHHVSSLVAAGMNDYICKPFKQAALLEKVAFWLNRPATLPIPTPAPEKLDETIVDEACELMGRPWVVRGLTKLRERIDEAFGSEFEVTRQSPQLTDQAHALVSLAALLGFSHLSQLCSTLEDACRSGHEVQQAFEHARSAAFLARKAATDLIAT